MKILILNDNLTSGGKERRLVELIKGFQNYPDVDLNLVIFKDDIHYKEIWNLNVKVTVLKRVPKKNPAVFYRLFKLCKNLKPDLIHSWGTMSTILAIPSSVLLRIKLINGNIADAPNNLSIFDSRLFRAKLTFPFSTVVTGNSLAGLKAYSAPASKSVCIYNGFDTNRLVQLEEKVVIRDKFKISTEYVVGMVGKFAERKDFETFINAALLVLQQRKDLTFVAVGDGPNLEKCKAMISAEYAPYFKFTGLQRDVESIVNIFDIGVLSTNTKVHGEGISNAILEYMALAKPTVATIGGGTNEAIDDTKTGFLVPPNSPDKMANKLIFLLENPSLSNEMGLQARQRVDTLFSLDQMVSSFYSLYQRLLVPKKRT